MVDAIVSAAEAGVAASAAAVLVVEVSLEVEVILLQELAELLHGVLPVLHLAEEELVVLADDLEEVRAEEDLLVADARLELARVALLLVEEQVGGVVRRRVQEADHGGLVRQDARRGVVEDYPGRVVRARLPRDRVVVP